MTPFFKHFSLLEFFPHCSHVEIVEALSSRSVSRNIVHLCLLLDSIRDSIGVPVRINSAYRSLTRNAKVGGVPTSQHLLGSAADVRKSRKLCDLFNSHRDRFHDLPDFLHRLGIYQLIEYDTFYHIGIYDEKHDPEHYPSVYINKTTKIF
uniref:Peptidase n=1 Tax=Dulem virus 261 TaxID=3145738 RepID=A0AAU8AZ14_9VIRU